MTAKVLDVDRLVEAVQGAYHTTSSVVLKKDKREGAHFSYQVTLGKSEELVGESGQPINVSPNTLDGVIIAGHCKVELQRGHDIANIMRNAGG